MNAKLLPLLGALFFGLAYATADEPPSKPGESAAAGTSNAKPGDPPEPAASPAASTEKPSTAATPGESNGSLPAEKREKNPSEPSPEMLSRWIAQLDSDEYWTREDASKRLFRAGRAAIGALRAAADSEKLEVSSRAVAVLSRLLELEDPQAELAAETALEEIAEGRVTSAAARAESALESYRGSRQERALARLRQLGATIATRALPTGEIALVHITIGEGWRGDGDDLAALKRIPSLQRLSIYVESVDDDDVKHLASLKQLTDLELFGTAISAPALEKLAASLAPTRVDGRKGGLLGVQGSREAKGGGCLVTGVQQGSAADKAGLQPGDKIVKFEGAAVADFTSLTKLIATKGGGETVELEIERQSQTGDQIETETLHKKATLDQWKNQPLMNASYGDLEIIIGR
jgi:hypothetical protein